MIRTTFATGFCRIRRANKSRQETLLRCRTRQKYQPRQNRFARGERWLSESGAKRGERFQSGKAGTFRSFPEPLQVKYFDFGQKALSCFPVSFITKRDFDYLINSRIFNKKQKKNQKKQFPAVRRKSELILLRGKSFPNFSTSSRARRDRPAMMWL